MSALRGGSQFCCLGFSTLSIIISSQMLNRRNISADTQPSTNKTSGPNRHPKPKEVADIGALIIRIGFWGPLYYNFK